MTTLSNFFSEHVVKGRKDYVCNACRREIPKATEHVTVSGCTEGRHWASRYHIECAAVVGIVAPETKREAVSV